MLHTVKLQTYSLFAVLLWTAAWCAPLAAQAPAAAAGTAVSSPTGASTTAAPVEAVASEPNAAVQTEYRDTVARAVVEFDAGRWNEARALFVRAHELWPSARSLRTLGMTAYELRNYAQALTELQAALDDPRRALDPDERAQVSVLIEQTRAFVGRYRVRLSPADAALMVDNAPRALGPEGVLVLEVGTHELVARAEGREPMRRRLDVQGREDAEIELTLAPTADAQVAAPATPSVLTPEPSAEPKAEGGSRLWTWIVGGTAVALGATSAGLWLASESKYDKLRDKCDKTPCERGTTDTSSIATLETAHQVTLGLALTAGVGALVLYFVEGDSDEHQAEGVSIGLGTLGVHGRF